MLRRNLLAPLAALILAGALAGTSGPAQAAAPGTAAAVPAAGSSAVTVRIATTEQVLAMAAQGQGQLMTLGDQAAKGLNPGAGGGRTTNVVCVLTVGTPYGSGAANSHVFVTAYVTCNGYVDLATLTVQLFHNNDAAGNSYIAYVHVSQYTATAASSNCLDGTYYGVAFGTITLNGSSDATTSYGNPLIINCASPPAPPAPPAPLSLGNPGTQQTLDTNPVNLPMSATGGSPPYSWSAAALPTGMSINASTGVITGRSSRTGWYPVTVTVTDAVGRTANTQFTWIIKHDGCAKC